MRLRITGGRLYDPASDWHGAVRDLFIRDDRIVPHLSAVERVIEAQGHVVVAGGIDLRGQVATYGLDFLRLRGLAPTLPELGECYATLGYTHVHEPFLTLYTAGYVHRELAALPLVDTSASLVLNLRDLDLWLRSPDRLPEVRDTIQFLMEQTRTLTLRVVEPCVRYRQEFYAPRTIKTDAALEILARLAQTQPAPLALEAGPEVLRASLPEPRLFHLAALGPALVEDALADAAQRHLEGGTTADMGLFTVNTPNGPGALPLKIDLGWFKPLDQNPAYSPEQGRRAVLLALNYAGANLAFSGASPALARVEDYPLLLSWLWDRKARRQSWGDALGPRHYSLSQWVWATRTLPARLLGLADRGRLSPGARADVAIYALPPDTPPAQWGRHLGRCRTLLKAGEVVVDDFQVIRPGGGKATSYRHTGAEPTPLVAEIMQYGSWRAENLWMASALETSWEKL